ncbi:hypothetical protein C8R45DRAFT_1075387 [Mycena sanguinolenta]|nr:hypothetical protein C8R45DRAFT_1075387 [Mycena sanguinolenta]
MALCPLLRCSSLSEPLYIPSDSKKNGCTGIAQYPRRVVLASSSGTFKLCRIRIPHRPRVPHQQQQRISSTNTTANEEMRGSKNEKIEGAKIDERKDEDKEGLRRRQGSTAVVLPVLAHMPAAIPVVAAAASVHGTGRESGEEGKGHRQRRWLVLFGIRLSAHLEEARDPPALPPTTPSRARRPARSFVVSLLDEDRVVDRGLIDLIDNRVRLGYEGTASVDAGSLRPSSSSHHPHAVRALRIPPIAHHGRSSSSRISLFVGVGAVLETEGDVLPRTDPSASSMARNVENSMEQLPVVPLIEHRA